MSPLERRCRWLLRAYPGWYRRERGEEMLATLLEASQPGQSWPSARDMRALIIGGLRVRAAQEQRLTTAANLRLAVQLGAALTLLSLVASEATSDILSWTHVYSPNAGTAYWFASAMLGLAAVVAAWLAPRPVDARPAMAMGVYVACTYLVTDLLGYVGYGITPLALWQWGLPAVGVAVLATGAFWRLRRQAVL